MKDRDSFLDLMVRDYEERTQTTLSVHDPVFHAFNSVANVADIISVYGDKEARERYILTAKRRNSVISHAIGMGYTPKFLEPDRHNLHIVFSGGVPEDMVIPENTRVRTEIEGDTYTVAEVIYPVAVFTGDTEADVWIEVGQTVEEFIGEGSGTEIQLPLDGDYVYVDSLTLKVVTPLGTEIWTKVDNFLQSNERDQHFMVEVGAKNFNDMMKPNDLMLYLRCGDGLSGKVFPENSQIYAVYREVNPYQDTMPLNTFTILEDSIMYVESITNNVVVKEKVMPEDIEIIRRNAIYTKSIGNTLVTKEDFERATILQGDNYVTKAYVESIVDSDSTIYTIYIRGDMSKVNSGVFRAQLKTKLNNSYPKNLNTDYNIVVAPEQTSTLNLTIMYQPDLTDARKTEIKEAIKDILIADISLLNLGETYTIPALWNSIISETETTLNGLAYIQINSVPPTVTYNAELIVPRENIIFTEL